jgi:hypothetical protein
MGAWGCFAALSKAVPIEASKGLSKMAHQGLLMHGIAG